MPPTAIADTILVELISHALSGDSLPLNFLFTFGNNNVNRHGAMKRLVSFLILAAFLFGIAGGMFNRLPADLQVRASTHDDGPQFSIYLSDEESSQKLDVDEQPLTPPGDQVSLLETSRETFPAFTPFRPASSRHYCWLGLGCGGLPS